jgi:serine/threonine protein kinase/Tol biopolymer transport system component
MPLAAGTKLDGYEILGLLGAGGMGEVYRARDPALKREVAIKVLPSFVSQDPDRLRRFEQEAQAAAALNQPNILAVHQFGTFEGAPYLVSELLEGSTLRQLLQRGPIPIRKAIDYGIQIAHGLAAAHDKGIVHRDLKPENLFVTKDGHIKILDFGLAKLMQRQPEPDGIGPTKTHGTDPGMVMGTVGYMAPEQVRGKPVDHRADIFAFGAILYEVLSGKRAFQRSTSAETMTAILNDDPPAISQIVQASPPGLQRVVHRCLEKNPEQRFQSASDLAFALEALSDSGTSTIVANAQGSRSRWVWIGAAGAVVAPAVLLIAWWRIPPAVPVVESVTQLTDDGERKHGPLVSDGTRIYFNEGQPDNWRVAQVSIAGGPVAFVETSFADPDIVGLAHDGSALFAYGGFYYPGPLWMIPLPAGEAHRIGSYEVQWADIFPDGRIVFTKNIKASPPTKYAGTSGGSDLFIADKDGLNPRKLVSVPGYIFGINVSPDGQRILLEESRNGTYLLHEIAANGTGLREILKFGKNDCCYVWNSDRKYVLYSSGDGKRSDIWALPLGGMLSRRSREPIRLTTGPISFTEPYPSRDGKQIFVTGLTDRAQLVHYDLQSHQFLPFLGGISATDTTFSRDGKWVVYRSYPDHGLWRSRSDGSERLQLTSPPMETVMPWISRDGTKVSFSSNYQIFLIDMNGGQPQRIVEKGDDAYWSPDGNAVVFESPDGLQIYDLHTGKASPVPGAQHIWGPYWVTQDTLVAATEGPNRQVKYLTFDFKTQKWTDLFTATVENTMITPDNKYLYFTTGGAESKLERFGFADRQIETITSLKDFRQLRSGYTQINVAPDGSTIFTRDTSTQEVYALNVRWP